MARKTSRTILRIGGGKPAESVVHDDSDEYMVPDGKGGMITAMEAYPEAFEPR